MVTASRRRVLISYMRLRRQGILPSHAMQAVLTYTHRELLKDQTTHRQAELEWDRAYARRYLAMIDMRAALTSYWGPGRIIASSQRKEPK